MRFGCHDGGLELHVTAGCLESGGGGDDGVADDLAPFANTAVRGDEDGAALVAARHKLKEEMSGVGVEGQIAELIDDEHFRLRPAS